MEIRYTAVVDAEDITIIRDIKAGISGPFGSIPLPGDGRDFTTDELTAQLAANGYDVTGDWLISVCYDGLRVGATVSPR